MICAFCEGLSSSWYMIARFTSVLLFLLECVLRLYAEFSSAVRVHLCPYAWSKGSARDLSQICMNLALHMPSYVLVLSGAIQRRAYYMQQCITSCKLACTHLRVRFQAYVHAVLEKTLEAQGLP